MTRLSLGRGCAKLAHPQELVNAAIVILIMIHCHTAVKISCGIGAVDSRRSPAEGSGRKNTGYKQSFHKHL